MLLYIGVAVVFVLTGQCVFGQPTYDVTGLEDVFHWTEARELLKQMATSLRQLVLRQRAQEEYIERLERGQRRLEMQVSQRLDNMDGQMTRYASLQHLTVTSLNDNVTAKLEAISGEMSIVKNTIQQHHQQQQPQQQSADGVISRTLTEEFRDLSTRLIDAQESIVVSYEQKRQNQSADQLDMISDSIRRALRQGQTEVVDIMRETIESAAKSVQGAVVDTMREFVNDTETFQKQQATNAEFSQSQMKSMIEVCNKSAYEMRDEIRTVQLQQLSNDEASLDKVADLTNSTVQNHLSLLASHEWLKDQLSENFTVVFETLSNISRAQDRQRAAAESADDRANATVITMRDSRDVIVNKLTAHVTQVGEMLRERMLEQTVRVKERANTSDSLILEGQNRLIEFLASDLYRPVELLQLQSRDLIVNNITSRMTEFGETLKEEILEQANSSAQTHQLLQAIVDSYAEPGQIFRDRIDANFRQVLQSLANISRGNDRHQEEANASVMLIQEGQNNLSQFLITDLYQRLRSVESLGLQSRDLVANNLTLLLTGVRESCVRGTNRFEEVLQEQVQLQNKQLEEHQKSSISNISKIIQDCHADIQAEIGEQSGKVTDMLASSLENITVQFRQAQETTAALSERRLAHDLILHGEMIASLANISSSQQRLFSEAGTETERQFNDILILGEQNTAYLAGQIGNKTYELQIQLIRLADSHMHNNQQNFPNASQLAAIIVGQIRTTCASVVSSVSAGREMIVQKFREQRQLVMANARLLRTVEQVSRNSTQQFQQQHNNILSRISSAQTVIITGQRTIRNEIISNTSQAANPNVRLAGCGSTCRREGRLEVRYSGTWGTVCDDAFDTQDAKVACYSLGFGRVGRTIGHRYGAGTGRIWLDELRCTGRENQLFSCPHSGVGRHDCVHREDISISCT